LYLGRTEHKIKADGAARGDVLRTRRTSSQHYTLNADGSIDIADTGLFYVVHAQGGLLALDTGRHVLHAVPIYDNSGHVVSFEFSPLVDAGPQDDLFPAVCEALA
jgi:hypothetical protein